MEVHNLMEDLVLQLVDEICSESAQDNPNAYCTTMQRRQDIACFVLNRLSPTYVTSARGVAHTDQSLHGNAQLKVDVVTLIHEGLRRVSHVQRPYYSAEAPAPGAGPSFNFPTVKGRLLSSTTFEPLVRGSVELLVNGSLVEMIDPRWQNPFPMNPQIPGTFLFLPRPMAAKAAGESMQLELEVSYREKGFEEFHHFFTLTLKADEEPDYNSVRTGEHRLAELFVAPS